MLLSPQSSLMKFAESLQEMINYHTVRCCRRRRVKPDALFLRPSSLPPLQPGDDKSRPDWHSAAALLLSRGFYCFWERLQRAAREEMAPCFRWPWSGGGKMTERLQKCHGDFEKDNHTLSSWFCFFRQMDGFQNLHTRFMGKSVLWS